MLRFGLLASLLVVVSATSGCTGQVAGPGPGDSPGVQLSAEVRQPAAEGALEVVVEPDTLRIYFDGEPPAYAVGDVVYGTEGPGYLRRVVSVERDDRKVVLHTVDADFGDAFDEVQLEARVPVVPLEGAVKIAPTWRTEPVVIHGVTYTAEIRHDAPVAAPVARSLTTSIVWEFPRLSITLTDPSGHVAMVLAADKLRIEKQITLDVKVDFGFFSLKELRFIDEEDTRATLEGVSLSATGSLTVADVSLPVFKAPALAVVPVGPLVFTVGASVDLGASLGLASAAEVHTTSGVGFHEWRRSGVTWDGQFHIVDESTHEADADFGSLSASATPLVVDAAVSVTGALNFMLYGVAGPEIFATVSPVVANMTFGTSAVDGTLSASASAGARFVFPFFKLANTSVTFAKWSQEYGSFHKDY
jgi:hypothetical protein